MKKPKHILAYERTRTPVEDVSESLLSIPQAADKYNIPRSTIYYNVWMGTIPTIQLGHSRFVRPKDITDFARIAWRPLPRKEVA